MTDKRHTAWLENPYVMNLIREKERKMNMCYELYKQGKTFEEISAETGIPLDGHIYEKDSLDRILPKKEFNYNSYSVQYYIGLKLMELCRKNKSCPTKAMLPEVEIIEEV